MSLHVDGLSELLTDRQILEGYLAGAERSLQAALRELDHLLQESTCSAYGFAREPYHKERCVANGEALSDAHEDIAKCKKDLFHFKMKHGE
jgi:hypothetical protein